MVSRSPISVFPLKGHILHCTCSRPSRHPQTVYSGGGRLGYWCWDCAVSAITQCAVFSQRFSPAERNYDMANHDLLAIKIALKRWRHWLEGLEQPFLICTNHKNVSYIQHAKQLNSWQARWQLFFNRFNFFISYRPSSRSTKPDALYRQFSPESNSMEAETILPTSCVVGAVTREMETGAPDCPNPTFTRILAHNHYDCVGHCCLYKIVLYCTVLYIRPLYLYIVLVYTKGSGSIAISNSNCMICTYGFWQ